MGNSTPIADLMVVSPSRREMFLVDVKGLYRKNPWLLERKAANAKLFYILAYVPMDQPSEFFIITQNQATRLIESELKRLGRPDTYPVTGFLWRLAEPHRDAWDILPR